MQDGVLLVDKPAGITSHDVVARVRRELGVRRVGHAGTLDPFATGLLLVLVGRATRIQRLLMALPKTYTVVAQLGATSTTGDPEGEVKVTGRIPPLPLRLPHGRIRQRPPAYSAVKVDGERAYARARRGEEVELPEREVEIHSFEQLALDGDRVTLRVCCSSGTYVRSLVSDLGDAYCLQLRRDAIGAFDLSDAGANMRSIEAALRFMPQLRLVGASAKQAAQGRPIEKTEYSDGDEVLLVDDDGAIAVARAEGGLLKPRIGFRG